MSRFNYCYIQTAPNPSRLSAVCRSQYQSLYPCPHKYAHTNAAIKLMVAAVTMVDAQLRLFFTIITMVSTNATINTTAKMPVSACHIVFALFIRNVNWLTATRLILRN